jgi:hypothetical protein
VCKQLTDIYMSNYIHQGKQKAQPLNQTKYTSHAIVRHLVIIQLSFMPSKQALMN